METNDQKNGLSEELNENQESFEKIKDENQLEKEVVKEEESEKVEAIETNSENEPETASISEETSIHVSSDESEEEDLVLDNQKGSIEEGIVSEVKMQVEPADQINPEKKEKVLENIKEKAPVEKAIEEDKTIDNANIIESEPDSEKETKESKGAEVDKTEIKSVDYSTFSLDDLVNTLTILIADRPIHKIKSDLDQIKSNFYKKLKVVIDKKKADFEKEGGKIEDFKPEIDSREEKLKEAFTVYKRKKLQYIQQLEHSKQGNLEEKYRIIEGIKGLINKEESINKTFHEFRDLQNRWRAAGLVPQSKLKDLWENYHYHVEKFYDFIKINKELRDLDLKKNLELKITLCEKAENLMLESNIVMAFRTLQKYHEQWREIGPVPIESKDEIWDRFRLATSKINRKHQKHFEDLKDGLRKNLEAKTELCEKVEDVLKLELKLHKDWEKFSREIIGFQKAWKSIGFAPKKHNTVIYDRFRKACDDFFNQKREFYSENKELQQNNLQLKTDLCVQAEALKDSEEWKKATIDLIALQKKWKEIGPVPRKVSDKVWKRFRAACDVFFNRKSEFYANIDQTYDDNYKTKVKLIEQIESYTFVENMDENFEKLKDFQRQWAEIGYVPLKKKEAILQKYRKVVDDFFDRLNIDDSRKNMLKFKNKLSELESNPNAKGKLYSEREKFINKVKKLESDIVLWENNIGFFAKSESANSMIEEFTKKIDQAKKNLENLKDKIKMIDNL